MSWPLVFEIPIYINELRFFRTFSVAFAWLYMLYYVFNALDWGFMLWLEPEATYESYDFLSVMYNMFLAFNIIFNIHILPVNIMIIIKEITLEIFPPLLDQDEGENLGLSDVEDTIKPESYKDIFTGKLPDQENSYAINRGNGNIWGKDRFRWG